MTTLTQDLIDRGMKLTPDERERFANLLLDSLDEPAAEDRELQEELQRRWDRYKSGDDPGYSLEEVMESLKRQADGRKA